MIKITLLGQMIKKKGREMSGGGGRPNDIFEEENSFTTSIYIKDRVSEHSRRKGP